LGLDKFSTQTAAERHLEAFVLKLNAENPTLAVMEPTFDAILDRFSRTFHGTIAVQDSFHVHVS